MLFVGDEPLLFFDLTGDLSPRLGHLAATRLFSFLFGDLLVELDARFALEVESLDVLKLLLLARIVLLRFLASLAGFLVLAHQDGLLDLALLDVALLAHLHDSLPVLGRDHVVVVHLLHFLRDLLVVALFQLHHFAGTLASLLDLLTRLHLFLLEEGDAVCEELSVSLHTT